MLTGIYLRDELHQCHIGFHSEFDPNHMQHLLEHSYYTGEPVSNRGLGSLYEHAKREVCDRLAQEIMKQKSDAFQLVDNQQDWSTGRYSIQGRLFVFTEDELYKFLEDNRRG